MEGIEFRCGCSQMDFEQAARMLSSAPWSRGIGPEEVRRGAEGSALVAGAFAGEMQVAYGRVISDKTRFAYISDVIVEESWRGKGIGEGLMRVLLGHESLKDVYQWLLHSSADGLYRKLGFVPLTETDRWMERRTPRR